MTHDFNKPPHVISAEEKTHKKRVPVYILILIGIFFIAFIDDSLLIGFGGSLIPNAIPTTLIFDQDGKVAVRISGEVTVAGLKKMLDKVLAND